MIHIQGRYNEAKIFTDRVDGASIAQVETLCDQEFTVGSRIRLMPDIHAGAGCTIGTIMTITDKVVPNLVGVDIGCGMETVRIRESRLELQKLDKLIAGKIPSGFSIREKAHPYFSQVPLSQLHCADHLDLGRRSRASAPGAAATTSSRWTGMTKETSTWWSIPAAATWGWRWLVTTRRRAYRALNGTDDTSLQALAAQMRAEGREKEISRELKRRKNRRQTAIPKAMAYVTGELFRQYLHDMKIVQQFAMVNRQAMMDETIQGMKLHPEEWLATIHNYIDTDAMILRKGAVSAKAGERLLIPINMRDGSLLCVGKGNEDWNYSAPHGAGRLMSRAEARQSFTVSQFKK